MPAQNYQIYRAAKNPGSVKMSVTLVKNGSFLVKIQIWKSLSKRSILMPVKYVKYHNSSLMETTS